MIAWAWQTRGSTLRTAEQRASPVGKNTGQFTRRSSWSFLAVCMSTTPLVYEDFLRSHSLPPRRPRLPENEALSKAAEPPTSSATRVSFLCPAQHFGLDVQDARDFD